MSTVTARAGLDVADLTFSPVAPLASEGDVRSLGNDRWLLADTDGLQLLSNNTPRDLFGGVYESLDLRSDVVIDGQAVTLLAAIDAESGDVVVIRLAPDIERFDEVLRIQSQAALPEVVCLYRDPYSFDISLFSVSARGMLDQRFIYDGRREALVDVPVRSDAAVLHTESCVVDDEQGSLFLADEGLGVLRMAASQESDAELQLLMPTEPWGDIEGEVNDLVLDKHGTLWMLASDAGRVYARTASGAVSAFAMPKEISASALEIEWGAESAHVILVDEASAQLMRASIDLPVPQRTRVRSAGAPRAALMANTETVPVRRYGDAADDPAIFPGSGDATRILGTDKREGLLVYNLDGELLQSLPVGRLNNVDLLLSVPADDSPLNLAAASNRSNRSISLFELREGLARHLDDFKTGLGDVYGLCTYLSDSGAYVFINDTDGNYEQHRLVPNGPSIQMNLVREFALPSQPEGCAADAETGRIYMGEEGAGIWLAGAEPDGQAPQLVIGLGDDLVADVEGMSIYRSGDRAFLVVSSQGSDSFTVYDLDDGHKLVASFSIAANIAGAVDGVSETDGLAVTATPLPAYPQGILVVQDGRNRMPDAPQNFKIIDWQAVQNLIDRDDG